MESASIIDFKRVKAIVFDFGGVLINLNRQAAVDAFSQLGIYDTDRYLNNYIQSDLFLQLELGHILPEDFRASLRLMSTKIISDQQIDDAWCAFLEDIPSGKLELLLQLRKRYRVLMLSNTNAIHFEFCKRERFNYNGHSLTDFFDHCYLSYQMHLVKPSQDIFNALLADASLKAEECLFLDDSPENIKTARNLGFQSILIEANSSILPYFLNIM